MRTFKAILTLCAAAALVAACQQPAGDGKAAGEAGGTGGASASSDAPAAAFGIGSEGPRAGKWRVTTAMDGMPEGMAMPAVETCIEATTLEEMQRDSTQAQAGANCSEQSFRREGNAMVGHSVCTYEGGMRSVVDTRVTGDLSRRYVMEVRSQTTPAPAPGMGDSRMTMTAERIGDC